MTTTNDRRTDAERGATIGFVVFTDSFMSGWGEARGGRSLYALAVVGGVSVDTLLENGAARTDMKRGRWVRRLPRLRAGDHLSVVGPTEAARWYQPGGFASGR